ncbi:immunity repressor [Gordonia phage Dardanus]|uniref:Immunity repressor n=1 Tax=Gordonia phage Dardanus TaxID=2588489 RepID=A0A514CX31_9CAUD|nr:transcriptional repressor [Gordonia phage Dardanus]QDH85073.1 immunity repressor [Gordonia phage Dardanus]
MDDFRDYLEAVIGRRPTREELAIATGVSAATIGRRKDEGFSLDEMLAILDYFGESRTAALIALGTLDLRDVMDQVGADGRLVDTTSTAELAAEVARRLGNEAGDSSDMQRGRTPKAGRSRPTSRPSRLTSCATRPRR